MIAAVEKFLAIPKYNELEQLKFVEELINTGATSTFEFKLLLLEIAPDRLEEFAKLQSAVVDLKCHQLLEKILLHEKRN